MSKISSSTEGKTLRISTSSDEPILLQSEGNCVTILEPGVRVTILEDVRNSLKHEIRLGARSELFLCSTIDNAKVHHTFELQDEAHATSTFLLQGSASHSCVSTCKGSGATSTMNACVLAKGTEKTIVDMRNEFLAKNGGGEMLLKILAEEKGFADIQAKIVIGPNGNETDTYLTQDVLLLDSSAKADAVPGLEIHTNDVRASHSASVARITPEDLFYMQSRGLEVEEARRLFIIGFFGAVAERSGSAAAEEKVLEWITNNK
jgi:Fe-S cluster assembly scaffold protein SufB